MDYIYGSLNEDVEPVEYFGVDTDTANIDIDQTKREIRVNVKKVPKTLTIVSGDEEVVFDGSKAVRLEVGDKNYVAGDGINIEDKTISIDENVVATKDDLSNKQDALVSEENIKTINHESILGSGNLDIERVPFADNLYSSDSQSQEASFIERTSGGGASIDTGTATLLTIYGSSTNPTHIEEHLDETVWQSPRFTAEVDLNTWLLGPLGDQSGDYTFIHIGNGWQHMGEDVQLSVYGITATLIGESYVDGDSIYISFRYNEADAQLSTISCDYRNQPRIEVELDRDEWVSHVEEGGTYAFYYNGDTQNWRLDNHSTGEAVILGEFGIYVYGDPIDLDRIIIEYTKEDFGTIINATPTSFNSVGFNLFNPELGYAKVIGVEDGQWYVIEGTYENVYFSYTADGALIPIQPVHYTIGSYSTDNAVEITQNGYLHLTGTDDTTMVNLIWSGYMIGADYQPYELSKIEIPSYDKHGVELPHELCRVGVIRDKIDFTTLTWEVKVQKDAYTPQALAELISSHPTWKEGVEYEWDNSFIYYVKSNPITYDLSNTISSVYNVSDFGIEYFEGTSLPVLTHILYGQNLKDKLRTDVLTISAQTLTDAQKRQVWENLGLYFVDNEEF